MYFVFSFFLYMYFVISLLCVVRFVFVDFSLSIHRDFVISFSLELCMYFLFSLFRVCLLCYVFIYLFIYIFHVYVLNGLFISIFL